MDFDKEAAAFDTPRRIKRAKKIANEISKYIPAGALSAIEFGCGTGLVGIELVERFLSIIFIDSSQCMIDKVNEKIAKKENAFTICADILSGLQRLDSVDVIFSSMVLHHINDIEEAFSKLNGLLKEDGVLIFIDLDREDGSFHANEVGFNGHNGFDHEYIYAALKKTGYHNMQIETFYYGDKEIGDKLIPYSLFLARATKCENVCLNTP